VRVRIKSSGSGGVVERHTWNISVDARNFASAMMLFIACSFRFRVTKIKWWRWIVSIINLEEKLLSV